MQIHQQDINNIVFFPNIGMGKVKFTYSEKDVINIFGKPLYKKTDYDANFVNYDYNLFNVNISLFFQYEEQKFDYLSIHTNKLIIGEKEISLLSQTELKEHLLEYHNNMNIDFAIEVTKDEIEECFEFCNIGLTIWYEEDIISDICIQPVF